MHVTIIGTGNMARGIATRLVAGDHEVTLLGSEAGKGEELAGELGGSVSVGTVGDPIAGDVIVLTVPYDAAEPRWCSSTVTTCPARSWWTSPTP